MRVDVVLAYPNTEKIAMADPPFQALYGRLRLRQDLALERTFLPDDEGPQPLLRSESKRPLLAFDFLVLFLSDEHDAFGVLKLLKLGGLPLFAKEREGDLPLVFLMGPLASMNPEPLADFMDAVFLEEEAWGEVPQLFRLIREGAFPPGEKRDLFLRKLLQITGVYVPRFYEVRYTEDGTVETVIPREGAPLPAKQFCVPRSTFQDEQGVLQPGTWNVEREALFTIFAGAATERLRRFLGRPLGDEALFEIVERFAETEIPYLRLTFLIGLPTETDEDVLAIPELAKRIKHRVLERRGDERQLKEVVLNLRTFFPRPWTIFQWSPMEEVGVLEARLKAIEGRLKSSKGIRLVHDLPKWAYLKAVLARGDRRISRFLLLALHYGGDWKRAFLEWHLNPDFFARRRRSLDEVFPWDHLGTGKEALIEGCREAGLP